MRTPDEPDYGDLPQVPALERTLDGALAAYGSGTRFPLYDTEFGYQTSPPEKILRAINPTIAAAYMNWAEYISWRNPRLRSFEQYLLYDPLRPTRADNWANKAVAGQQFFRLARQGGWDAIYYGGQVAWFYNAGQITATATLSGTLITPRAGRESIPVYGRAYPEAAAYPPGREAQEIVPIYTMPAGQVYVPVESPRGELGYHVVSDGSTRPWRVHVRDPSFVNLQATAAMSEGGMIADVIAAIASIDPVMGGVDR